MSFYFFPTHRLLAYMTPYMTPWIGGVRVSFPIHFFQASHDFTPITSSFSLSALQAEESQSIKSFFTWELFYTFDPACRSSLHQLCSIFWAKGRHDPGVRDTHPTFMEQHLKTSPSNSYEFAFFARNCHSM